jgi:CTD small phosphatase-like protein 2
VVRPHLKEFLKRMNKYFEIIVFTASHDAYAKAVVDYIDKNRRIIQGYLSRDHCYHTEDGAYVKDLRVLNRNLKDVVIVDNLVYSYAFQIYNGIPILPFENNKNDRELLDLVDYLKFLSTMEDVREVNKRFFKLDRFLECEDPEETAYRYFSDYVPKGDGII